MVPLDRAHGLTTGTLTTGTLALIFSVIAVFFAFKAKGEEDSLEGIFEAVFAFAAFVACAITLAYTDPAPTWRSEVVDRLYDLNAQYKKEET